MKYILRVVAAFSTLVNMSIIHFFYVLCSTRSKQYLLSNFLFWRDNYSLTLNPCTPPIVDFSPLLNKSTGNSYLKKKSPMIVWGLGKYALGSWKKKIDGGGVGRVVFTPSFPLNIPNCVGAPILRTLHNPNVNFSNSFFFFEVRHLDLKF